MRWPWPLQLYNMGLLPLETPMFSPVLSWGKRLTICFPWGICEKSRSKAEVRGGEIPQSQNIWGAGHFCPGEERCVGNQFGVQTVERSFQKGGVIGSEWYQGLEIGTQQCEKPESDFGSKVYLIIQGTQRVLLGDGQPVTCSPQPVGLCRRSSPSGSPFSPWPNSLCQSLRLFLLYFTNSFEELFPVGNFPQTSVSRSLLICEHLVVCAISSPLWFLCRHCYL